MRQLIIKTLILDRSSLQKQLRESFFKHLAILIETKTFFELQMMPDNNATSKIFKNNGGAKTAAAFICLKAFENHNEYTNEVLDSDINKLSQYLDITNDAVKEGILSHFNKDEAEKLISNQANLDDDSIQQLQNDIAEIISYSANDMTNDTLTHHREEIRKRNAIATTEATFNNKKTEETTAAVATALAQEGSMSTKTMEEYIEKRIKENLAKNFKRGGKPHKNDTAKTTTRRGKPNNGTTKKRKHFDGKNNEDGRKQPPKKNNTLRTTPKESAKKLQKHKRGDNNKKQHPQHRPKNHSSKNKSWTRNNRNNNSKRGQGHHDEQRKGKRDRRNR